MNRRELQTRMNHFSVEASKLTQTLKPNPAGNNLSQQLARCSTSPALNYAESQSAESTKDFVHKLAIALKELREAAVCLTVIEQGQLTADLELLSKLRSDCDSLVAILVSSLKTLNSSHKKAR